MHCSDFGTVFSFFLSFLVQILYDWGPIEPPGPVLVRVNVDGSRYCFIFQILILKGTLLTIGLWSRSCRNILQGQRILIFSVTRTYEIFHACLYFWKTEHSYFVGLFLFDRLHMWKGENLIKREKRGEITRGGGSCQTPYFAFSFIMACAGRKKALPNW